MSQPVLPQTDRWFPAVESTSVVGRIIDVEYDLPGGPTKKTAYRPAMQSKVAGSNDVSVQPLKDWNREEICARFPGAWEHYERQKAAVERGATLVDEPRVRGTPVDEGDLFNNERVQWFKSQGIYTLEAVRDMSDTTIENMGRSGSIGGKSWRKKAKQYLEAKAANGGHMIPNAGAHIG